MTPIKQQPIQEKLGLLEETIEKLEAIKKQGRQKFFDDFFVRDAGLRNLTVGIEIIVDIGNHILSEIFHTPAKEYKEIIRSLGKQGVIPPAFAAEHEEMAGFRHRLIHDYADTDYVIVFDGLEKAPDVFREFAKYYATALERYSQSA